MAGKVITLAQQKGGSGKTTLAVNLAVELVRGGQKVALLDTDPQGSLGRWFMARTERGAERAAAEGPGLDFSTASAWGVSYECEKLLRDNDFVFIDTPPKVDADLRPALRAADLILVPVASSHVDLWATEGVLDLARREGRPAMVVLNRCRAGTRLAEEVAEATGALDVALADTRLANRVVYAETLGTGRGAPEARNRAARAEIAALAAEMLRVLG